MWKVTIKGLLAHKLRLVLTAIAIVLGVTFISGTFVLTDTLHNTFTTLFGHIYQKHRLRGSRKARLRQQRRAGVRSASRSRHRSSPTSARFPACRTPTAPSADTPSSWPPTARPSAPAVLPTWGCRSTPTPSCRRCTCPGHGAHHAAPGPDGRGHRPQVPLPCRRPRPDTALRAPADLHHLRLGAVRHRQQPGRRDASPPSTCPRRSSSSTRRGASTPSTSWPSRASTRRRSSTPSPGSCRPGWRW